MPMIPLLPGGNDQMSSPMSPGPMGPPGGAVPPSPMGGAGPMAPGGPTGPGPGGDLASLLGVGGGAPPTAGAVDPIQMGLNQFDMLAQMISDIARMFPGSEQVAGQMMEALDQWRQQVLVMMTPQPSATPGADQMM